MEKSKVTLYTLYTLVSDLIYYNDINGLKILLSEKNLEILKNNTIKLNIIPTMSEDMVEYLEGVFPEIIDYNRLLVTKNYSEEFLTKRIKKLDMMVVSRTQDLSVEFIQQYKTLLDLNYICSRKMIISKFETFTEFNEIYPLLSKTGIDNLCSLKEGCKLLTGNLSLDGLNYGLILANHPELTTEIIEEIRAQENFNQEDLKYLGKNVDLPTDIYLQYKKYINLNDAIILFSKHESIKDLISETDIEDQIENLYTVILSKYYPMSRNFIARHAYRLNWKLMSRYQDLNDKNFLLRFRKFVNWDRISKYQKLNPEIVDDVEIQKYINWNWVLKYNSKVQDNYNFLEKYLGKTDPITMIRYCNLLDLDLGSTFEDTLFYKIKYKKINHYKAALQYQDISGFYERTGIDLIEIISNITSLPLTVALEYFLNNKAWSESPTWVLRKYKEILPWATVIIKFKEILHNNYGLLNEFKDKFLVHPLLLAENVKLPETFINENEALQLRLEAVKKLQSELK